MDADEIRTALVNTGTPQVGSGHIGPRPDLHAAMDQVLGVSMLADTTFGYVPLTVNFTGQSTKTVNSWDWDFGDGDVSSVQSPSHTYTAPGLFTVGLDIQTTEGPYATTRSQFIAAVADTIDGDSSTGAPGSSVRVDIYARNTIPTRQILIPFSWAGPLGLYFDSLTTTGLRTDYFESKNLIHFDPFGGNATLSLTASTGSSNPDLPSDTGAVVSLYFSIPSDVSSGTNPIAVGPYETYVPQYVTSRATYSPVAVSGVVSVCAKAGDADATGQLSISDVTYLIAYIFQGGPAPSPTSRGDADCNGDINISDATFLIAYIFQGGAAPCECAP